MPFRLPAHTDGASLVTWFDEWFAAYDRHGGVFSSWQEMQLLASPELMQISRDAAATVVGRLESLMRSRDSEDPLIEALFLLAVLERMPNYVFALRFAERAPAIEAAAAIVLRGLLGARPPRMRSGSPRRRGAMP